MEDLITIWTPVIISKLLNVHKAQEQIVYHLDQHYLGLEDVKIKVKKAEAGIHGKEVEVSIKLDVLCLVQDIHGDLQLVNSEEKLVNRIPAIRFSQPFNREGDLGFKVNLTNLKWEGELNGQDLKIRYGLDYMVLILQDQVVTISTANSVEPKKTGNEASIRQIGDEANRFREEKDELLQKLFCYERDITSLKKSIYKTEDRNAVLNRELIRYQQMVEQMQKAMEDKNNQLSQIQPEGNFSYWRTSPQPVKDNTTLTTRLKRMFITTL